MLVVCDLQRGAAAGSPAAGLGDPRGELETRPELPLHFAGLQPAGSAQPERYIERRLVQGYHLDPCFSTGGTTGPAFVSLS